MNLFILGYMWDSCEQNKHDFDIKLPCSCINSFPTDEDIRSFCGQCRSRLDCTESAV